MRRTRTIESVAKMLDEVASLEVEPAASEAYQTAAAMLRALADEKRIAPMVSAPGTCKYLVAIHRIDAPQPWEVRFFDDPHYAALYASENGWQWTGTYIAETIVAPGHEGQAKLDAMLRGES